MRRLSTAWLALACLLFASRPAFAADADFRAFLDTLRPEAEARGVSRATFDAATRELTPDLGLPDLALPGRPATGAAQAEFTQTPAAYLSERSLQNLAGRGRRLHAAAPVAAGRDRGALRRAGARAARHLGPRDGVRRRQAAARRAARARDASLCGAAQGALSRGVFSRPEAGRGGASPAGTAAQLLGRSDRPRAVLALGLSALRQRRRRRRRGRHLDLRAGRVGIGGEPARGQGLAAGATLGARGARAGGSRLHALRTRLSSCRSGNGCGAASRRRPALRRPISARRSRCSCPPARAARPS